MRGEGWEVGGAAREGGGGGIVDEVGVWGEGGGERGAEVMRRKGKCRAVLKRRSIHLDEGEEDKHEHRMYMQEQ